jgi:flagellar protein FlbD
MITLTRVNGQPVMLNCDLIEIIEENEHTVVTLTTGNAVVVCERMAEIEAGIVAFRRKVYGPRETSV